MLSYIYSWIYPEPQKIKYPEISFSRSLISETDLLKVNDGIPFRAKIESLIGKDIVLDAPIDVSYNNRLMSNVYGPATPRWINVGDFLFLSGATDTDDTDRCFIETIVLKNPHTFDIPVRYMIGR